MPNAMWNNIMGVLRVKVPSTGGVSMCGQDGYRPKKYRGWGVLIWKEGRGLPQMRGFGYCFSEVRDILSILLCIG